MTETYKSRGIIPSMRQFTPERLPVAWPETEITMDDIQRLFQVETSGDHVLRLNFTHDGSVTFIFGDTGGWQQIAAFRLAAPAALEQVGAVLRSFRASASAPLPLEIQMLDDLHQFWNTSVEEDLENVRGEQERRPDLPGIVECAELFEAAVRLSSSHEMIKVWSEARFERLSSPNQRLTFPVTPEELPSPVVAWFAQRLLTEDKARRAERKAPLLSLISSRLKRNSHGH